MQDYSNSIANTLKLMQPWAKPSKKSHNLICLRSIFVIAMLYISFCVRLYYNKMWLYCFLPVCFPLVCLVYGSLCSDIDDISTHYHATSPDSPSLTQDCTGFALSWSGYIDDHRLSEIENDIPLDVCNLDIWSLYDISHETCTWFCLALFCFG